MVTNTSVAFFLMAIVVFLATRYHTAFGLSCAGCEQYEDGFLQCPQLPSDCEPGKASCACCPSCRKKLGIHCSGTSTPCESGLACADESNFAPKPLTWWVSMYDFDGTCKNEEDVVYKPPEYWRRDKRDYGRRDFVELPRRDDLEFP